MKKHLIIALSFALLMAGAVTFAQQVLRTNSAKSETNKIPPQVAYERLFHQVALFKRKAAEKQQQGQDGSFLRSFHQRQARLNDLEAQTLDKIAADCDDQVATLDAHAKQIIASFRAQHQNEKLKPGQTPPAPPVELKAMQQQRDQIILRARDQVHAAFGENDFQRLEQYVQAEIASRIKPIAIDWSRPDIPGGPRQPGQEHPHK